MSLYLLVNYGTKVLAQLSNVHGNSIGELTTTIMKNHKQVYAISLKAIAKNFWLHMIMNVSTVWNDMKQIFSNEKENNNEDLFGLEFWKPSNIGISIL